MNIKIKEMWKIHSFLNALYVFQKSTLYFSNRPIQNLYRSHIDQMTWKPPNPYLILTFKRFQFKIFNLIEILNSEFSKFPILENSYLFENLKLLTETDTR